MTQPQSSPVTDQELVAELKAALAARRELGADMQDPIIESFMVRLQQRIDAQVAQQVQQKLPKSSKTSQGSHPAAVVVPNLALAIPLIAIAGNVAHGAGVVAVMAAVILINLLYYIDRWAMG